MGAAKRGSLAGAKADSQRGQGFCAVGQMVSRLAAPTVDKRGGGLLVRLKANWTAIIGPEWAAICWPFALGRDGVLKLLTAPAAAIELQHCSPMLIERINLYFGRSVVTRLVLVQGVLPCAPDPVATDPGPLAVGEVQALDQRLSGIADGELRGALDRLGRAVIRFGR